MLTDVPTYICSKCQQALPGKPRATSRTCKACSRAYTENRNARLVRDRALQGFPELAECIGCAGVYPATIDYYGPQASTFNGFNAACRTCVRRASVNKRARGHNSSAHQLTSAELDAVYERANGTCCGCGAGLAADHHYDHIVALSKGGSNTPDNLQALCKRCNSAKGDSSMEELHEYRRQMHRYEKERLLFGLDDCLAGEGTLTTDGVSRQTDSRQPTRLVSHSS